MSTVNTPVRSFRVTRPSRIVQALVWSHVDEDRGERHYTVSLRRMHLSTDGRWQEGAELTREDLPAARKLLQRANGYLASLEYLRARHFC